MMSSWYRLALIGVIIFWPGVPVMAQGNSDHVFKDIDRALEKSDEEVERIKRGPEDDEIGAARRKMQEDVDESRRRQSEDFAVLSAQMEARYRDYAKKAAEQREALRKLVLRQWSDFRESSPKEWVDHNALGDARSEVDFENGKITVEVLVPVEEAAPRKKVERLSDLEPQEREKARKLAEEKIADQAKKVLSQKDDGKTEVLKDQLQGKDGKPITQMNADSFVKEQIAPKMVIDEKPVTAEDGKPRLKVMVEIPMLPEHLKVRAQRYAPQVRAYAEKYGLDSALVFALIHTESFFNPMARSNAGALGLMQIVPKTAGIEAYMYVYKREKLITPEYLYEPGNNIELGTAYLHLLQSKHYGKLKNRENRRALSIAAYNCGPGNVRKMILSRADPDAVGEAELLRFIVKHAPKETQAYVPRVQGRIEMYRGF